MSQVNHGSTHNCKIKLHHATDNETKSQSCHFTSIILNEKYDMCTHEL